MALKTFSEDDAITTSDAIVKRIVKYISSTSYLIEYTGETSYEWVALSKAQADSGRAATPAGGIESVTVEPFGEVVALVQWSTEVSEVNRVVKSYTLRRTRTLKFFGVQTITITTTT